MIDLDESEDICDIFIEKAAEFNDEDGTIAVIANKELISYITKELLEFDWTSVKKIDFEKDDLEYMVSINSDGYVVAIPIELYKDKYFTDIDTAYISMDGDVNQDIIDKCLDTNKNVVLFGLSDDDCEDFCCEKSKGKDSIATKSNSSTVIRDEDRKLGGFSATWSDSNDDLYYSSSYSYYSNNEESVRELAKEFGINVD